MQVWYHEILGKYNMGKYGKILMDLVVREIWGNMKYGEILMELVAI